MNHAPTPWRAICNESGKTFEEIYEVRNEYGEICCYVPFPKKDTAAFIVKAVNSYEKQLALLKRNLERMELINQKCVHGDESVCINHILMKETREAIAKAGDLPIENVGKT